MYVNSHSFLFGKKQFMLFNSTQIMSTNKYNVYLHDTKNTVEMFVNEKME